MFKKYIKKIILSLVIVALFLGSIFFYVKPRLKADIIEVLPEHYNLMFVVYNQSSSVDFEVYIIYDQQQGPLNLDRDIDLTQVEYQGFTGYFSVGGIYFGAGSYDQYNLTLEAPYWALPYSYYVNNNSESFNQGYEAASIYYDNVLIPDLLTGYIAKSTVENNYTYNGDLVAPDWYTGAQYTAYGSVQYNEGIAYAESLDPDTLNTNFKDLMSTIFTYPTKFFNEAFDVEVMGINVGGLICGLFFLGVCLGILGIVRKVV